MILKLDVSEFKDDFIEEALIGAVQPSSTQFELWLRLQKFSLFLYIGKHLRECL